MEHITNRCQDRIAMSIVLTCEGTNLCLQVPELLVLPSEELCSRRKKYLLVRKNIW